MRTLLIGGTGLISTGITRLLVERGDEVTFLNRGRTAASPHPSVRILVGDRSDKPLLDQATEERDFDAVIDMVCFTPEQASLASDTFRGRVGQFLFCSTVDVYTKGQSGFPLDESAERAPSSTFAYAYDKARCEEVFERAANRAFELTIIRPAATYLDRTVAPIGDYQLYVERLQSGRPIVLHGDGSSIWPVAHRDDVAAAFAGAAGNPTAFGRAYNVTGEELQTWNAEWRQVAESLGAPRPQIVHIPTDALGRLDRDGTVWCRENFQFNNIVDNSAARRDLGYAYRTDWATGSRTLNTQFSAPVPAEVSRRFDRILDAWQQTIGSLTERAA